MIDLTYARGLPDILEFAINNGCVDKLIDKLGYLSNYAEGDNTCHLSDDFAENSFRFTIQRPDGTDWFHGGLMYSGPGQPLDGSGPAFTVGIGIDSSQHGWSVHT